jgi:DNA-binding MarR family transcriptional regulator
MSKRSADVETMAHELMGHLDELVREFLINEGSGNYSANEKTLLRFLRDHDSAVMSDLSVHLRLALSSTTGIVDRLAERKVVKRVRPEEDRRTVRVMLTNRGRQALEGLAADRVRLGRAMLDRLEPQRRETLLDLFRRMAGGAK